MQTSLRRMGNSTGLIVPKALLGELGVTTGSPMMLEVTDGKLVAAPMTVEHRSGWAAAAAILGETPDDVDWQAFGNEDDAELAW